MYWGSLLPLFIHLLIFIVMLTLKLRKTILTTLAIILLLVDCIFLCSLPNIFPFLVRKRLVSLYLVLFFSLRLLISLYGVNHSCNSLLLVLLVGMGKLYRLETLIHQQLNILPNDCDLSDKHVHYLHALHSDDCEQSDKLNIINH